MNRLGFLKTLGAVALVPLFPSLNSINLAGNTYDNLAITNELSNNTINHLPEIAYTGDLFKDPKTGVASIFDGREWQYVGNNNLRSCPV